MCDGLIFRDISEYKTAFAKSEQERPQSKPEQRPWLEAHLESQDAKSGIHPRSEPQQSLLHWAESKTQWAPHGRPVAPEAGSPHADQFDEERGSPYLAELRHSMSLDFGLLDTLDSM
jgi:hypothetical protein